MLGIGTDIVEVHRFLPWTTYSDHRLKKIFTMQEIDDCTDNYKKKSAEKLAVRFAAKEAFYKALSLILINQKIDFRPFSFLQTCQCISVHLEKYGIPQLIVNWLELSLLSKIDLPHRMVYLSIAHERTMAIAFVIIQ